MITEVLLELVMGFVAWFVSLVPDFGLDLSGVDFGGTWNQVAAGASALNGWLPVVAALGVAAAFFVVQVVVSVWGFIVWVYHQFWGSE